MLKVSCTWQSIYFSSLGFVTVIKCFIIVKKMLLFTVQCTLVSFNINTEDTLGSSLFYVMSKIILFDAIYLTDIKYLTYWTSLFKQTNKINPQNPKNLFLKFVLAVLVLSLILPKTSQYIKWIVSAGLAQVSEFSFVLGSRARRAGIISREVSCSVVINFFAPEKLTL